MLVTGIGGTGVITIGQILAMAAHLEAKGVSVLDMSGLAQKYGAVMSHVQLAPNPQALSATRIDTGGASLVIGCDLVVSASTDAIAKMAPGRTRAVVNASVTPTAEFVRNPTQVSFRAGLVLHDRRPADDLQVRDLCQIIQDFVLHTIIEKHIVGIGAQIFEGEDCNALVRNRRNTGWQRVR